ncbi:MAG TPA: exodeoxyribonuclease I, partial [Gammaproteobacteria bacterium]
MAPASFYWHDYETSGLDPARDRPLQFAGLRTDLELNPLGEPLTLFCRPAADLLPSPEACLVTGITPQRADAEGVCEAEFIARVHAELARPGTCALGYNTLRFDDEVTRHTLYRNLYDPYAREWRDGNSRWDLVDVTRATAALRPDGISWPTHEDGTPSFRLEQLTAANGLEHGAAHDALADVRGTLALARLLRARQPRLWDYLLELRRKQAVWRLLDLRGMTPLVHVSGRYPASRGCLAVVVPVARHPVNDNAVIVYDLAADPAAFDGLDAAAIAARVFSRADALPDGVARIP